MWAEPRHVTQINSHRTVVTIEAGAVTKNKNWEQESTGTRRSRKAPLAKGLGSGRLGEEHEFTGRRRSQPSRRETCGGPEGSEPRGQETVYRGHAGPGEGREIQFF